MKKILFTLCIFAAAAFASAGMVSVSLVSSSVYDSFTGDYSLKTATNGVMESVGYISSLGTHSGMREGDLPWIGNGSYYATNQYCVYWTESTSGEGLPAHLYCGTILSSYALVQVSFVGEGDAGMTAQVIGVSPMVGCSASFTHVEENDQQIGFNLSKYVATLSPTWTLVHTAGSGLRTWKTSPNISITTAEATGTYAVDGSPSVSEQSGATFTETYYFTSTMPSFG